jgi:hypothetical protein
MVALLVMFAGDGKDIIYNFDDNSFKWVNKPKDKDMTKREIALQKIEEARKSVEEARCMLAGAEKALKESEELAPYDWSSSNGFGIRMDHTVYSGRFGDSTGLKFSTRQEADKFAKKLKIMSVLNNLKKSLGDDAEAGGEDKYYHLEWDCNEWASSWFCSFNAGQIVFSSHNIEKVVEYMNEHHPEGWL